MKLGLGLPQIIGFGNFHVHADDVASVQARDLVLFMAGLELSQFILTPTHQTIHMLNLILGSGITVD